MNFKEKRVLVTGGAGFIGSQVIKQLIDYDAKVTVLDNFSSGKKEYLPKNKNLKIIKGDIQDEEITKKAVKDQEVVINLAALPFIPDSYYYPTDFFKVNTFLNILSTLCLNSLLTLLILISSSKKL